MEFGDFLKHVPGTAMRRQVLAEKAIMMWSFDVGSYHEIRLSEDTNEAQQQIDTALNVDASVDGLDVVEAREQVREVLEQGPEYRQRLLCIGYMDEGDPSILFV
jgi:hypothetical protein